MTAPPAAPAAPPVRVRCCVSLIPAHPPTAISATTTKPIAKFRIVDSSPNIAYRHFSPPQPSPRYACLLLSRKDFSIDDWLPPRDSRSFAARPLGYQPAKQRFDSRFTHVLGIFARPCHKHLQPLCPRRRRRIWQADEWLTLGSRHRSLVIMVSSDSHNRGRSPWLQHTGNHWPASSRFRPNRRCCARGSGPK